MRRVLRRGAFSAFGVMASVLLGGCGDNGVSEAASAPAEFVVPDTGQQGCFDADGFATACEGNGQDAAYTTRAPAYSAATETVTDNVTGLTWQQDADVNADGRIDAQDKMRAEEASAYCAALDLDGFDDWRLPDITALYSLIDFSGEDVSGETQEGNASLMPFIDTTYFAFGYGDTGSGERLIDSQWATTTMSVSPVMGESNALFGVNFADGRIKGYPTGGKTFYVRCVRGNTAYGTNRFERHGDGTVSDRATGLMWRRADSGEALNWEAAIAYCETDTTAGYSDWRLPDAKALQSIVDYTRSPDATGSAAIDPEVFDATGIINEAAQADYGFYWSSTTHKNSSGLNADAVYVSFGRAMGYLNGVWMDVHGAGAQRSDPKAAVPVGDPSYETVAAYGGSAVVHGPQGDVVRIENFARCVREEPGT